MYNNRDCNYYDYGHFMIMSIKQTVWGHKKYNWAPPVIDHEAQFYCLQIWDGFLGTDIYMSSDIWIRPLVFCSSNGKNNTSSGCSLIWLSYLEYL